MLGSPRVGIQAGPAGPLEHFAERRASGEFGTQRDEVEERPNGVLEQPTAAAGSEGRHDDVLGPELSLHDDLVSGEQHDGRRTPALGGQLRGGRGQVGGDPEAVCASHMRHARRPGEVGGQRADQGAGQAPCASARRRPAVERRVPRGSGSELSVLRRVRQFGYVEALLGRVAVTRSRMITRTDQPSVAIWCVIRASTESWSSNLASTALMSGGLFRFDRVVLEFLISSSAC